MGPFPACEGSDPFVFVCYSHEDADIVYRDIEWLYGRGVRIWYDEGIPAGVAWREELAQRIKSASLFIYFVSSKSIESNHCRREVGFALDERLSTLAVHLDSTPLPDGMRLALGDRQALVRDDLHEERYRERLSRAVERHVGGEGAAKREPVAPTEAVQLGRPVQTPATDGSAERHYSRRWLPIGAALATVAIVVAAIAWWRYADHPTRDLPPIRSLAVLPLTDLAAEHEAYFADGMTETLIAELSKLPGVRVISRTSVMEFKDRKMPLPEIAKLLNVDGIIEGSVMRVGDRVRITTQLIDARDDRHLWAEQYDRDAARVFEIQAEVAKAVANRIAIALTPQQARRFAAKRRPVDPRAQEAYFRGLAQRSEQINARNWSRSIDSFEEAIRIAPDYADAKAALAWSLWTTVSLNNDVRAVDVAIRVRDLARSAIALDDSLGDAHSALAVVMFYFDWDWVAAEIEFRRGHELGNIYWTDYQFFLMAMGRTQEAIAMTEARAAANPRGLFFGADSNDLYLAVGQYKRVLDQAERILSVDADYAYVVYQQIVAYAQLERIAEATTAVMRYGALVDGSVDPDFARRVAQDGDVAFWRQYQERCEQVIPALCAWAWTKTGENDRAMDVLEAAYQARYPYMPWMFNYAPLVSLHDNPRFIELARKMNIPIAPLDGNAGV